MLEEDDDITTVYALAIGGPEVSPRHLEKAFDAAMRARGGRPEEDSDIGASPHDGIELSATMHAFDVHGAWLLVETEHAITLMLAREIAGKLGRTVRVHALQVREEVVEVRGSEDGWGYRNQYRSLEVRPDGTMLDHEPPVDPDYAAVAHGDVSETASAILWMMVTEQEAYSPIDEPRYLTYLLPPPRTTGLPPRLAELATLISEAGVFSVQLVSGQTMVRLTLPDGSRRFSRVSPEELAQLRDATGIEPA